MLESSVANRVKSFYFNELIFNFPLSAHELIKRDFSKHLFEIETILENALSKIGSTKIKLLDVGAGAGINAIILSSLFNFECTILDRYDEFAEEHNRDIGNENTVVQTLQKYKINVVKRDFIADGFPVFNELFDIVANFDVIEHFNFSPAPFLTELVKRLSPNGYLIVGTPNQVHFFNRLKSLAGKNTWEDFEYFYSASKFFGHVREFTPAEVELLFKRQKGLQLSTIKYSCYPLFDRVNKIKSLPVRLICQVLTFPASLLFRVFKSLNYYVVAVGIRTT